MTVLIVIVTLVLAFSRLYFEPSDTLAFNSFKAFAHLFVGGLIGAWLGWGGLVRRYTTAARDIGANIATGLVMMESTPFFRRLGWLALLLSLVELTAFIWSRL